MSELLRVFLYMVLFGVAIGFIIEGIDGVRKLIHGEEACKKYDEEFRKEMYGDE